MGNTDTTRTESVSVTLDRHIGTGQHQQQQLHVRLLARSGWLRGTDW